ncbi:MAG: type II toxin-antitoxin system VapC family toxin [Desulfobacterales bacterium]|nr:type II toxin-antitoxin system VapC family toxin [Desulfobacterales bacterium]
MRLLLDTHILLWCLEESNDLPDQAYQLVLSADDVYASTVNVWEIIIKLSIGKLDLDIDVHDLMKVIAKSGFKILDIKPDHAIKLMDLEDYHRDPFDRMLIAQSLVEPLHLVTCDSVIAKYNANIIEV